MENVYVVLVGGNVKSVHKHKAGAHFAADQEIVEMIFDKDRNILLESFDKDFQRLVNGAAADGGLCNRDSADLLVLWEDFLDGLGEDGIPMMVEVKEFPLGA